MEYPTEEQIEAVVSELRVASEAHKSAESINDHDCEMCNFSKHLNKLMGKDEDYRPVIDKIAITHMGSDPMLEMTVLALGGGGIIISMARALFYVGLKVGANMEANRILIETFGVTEE